MTEAVFPARAVLPIHEHQHTVFAIMLVGGFSLALRRGTHECGAGIAVVEPAGERHSNTVGGAGAHVLVIELDAGFRHRLLPTHHRLLDEPRTFGASLLGTLAHGLSRRLRSPRPPAGPEIDAHVLELIETASGIPEGLERRAGPWLDRVRDVLHADLSRPPCVTALARELGIHRVHLGRAFRQRFGVSVAEYHRRLRVAWAESQLLEGDDPLSVIAGRAGFADHSHFTRVFRRLRGTTPARWRRSRRP